MNMSGPPKTVRNFNQFLMHSRHCSCNDNNNNNNNTDKIMFKTQHHFH